MQIIKNRLRRLETKNQTQSGQLPMVVTDETTAIELMRLSSYHPERLVLRFSESVEVFL